MGIGEISSLLAAALWATGSLIYGRTRLSAFSLNLAKNVMGATLLTCHLRAETAWRGVPMFAADRVAWQWLALSGVIGIVAGDTFYFRSLQILGPRRALVVSTTAPLIAAILGKVFLGETLGMLACGGMALTLGGVAHVISDRRAVSDSPGFFPGSVRQGVLMGLLAALCNAGGAVASRIGMQNCVPLEAATIRLIVSAVAALLIVAAGGRIVSVMSAILHRNVLLRLLPAVTCGTWLGIWLSQVGYKHTSIAVAMTLMATTPLFAIPMVRIVYGYPITLRSVVGAAIAMAGVYLTVA